MNNKKNNKQNPSYKGYCRPANKTFIIQPDDPRRQSYYPDYEVLMILTMVVLMMKIKVVTRSLGVTLIESMLDVIFGNSNTL